MTVHVARRSAIAGLASATTLLFGPQRRAHADDAWPSRPVRLVVPFGAGGAADTLSRAFAQRFPEHANGQPLAVENRTGAGGTIAAAAVASARPDGYTLLMGDMGPNTVAAEVVRGVPYDPATAFTPILHIADLPLVLVVKAGLPVQDLRGLIAMARARPDELTYASAGAGNTNHLAMELLLREAGVKMVHVPYRGGAELMTALLRGDVDLSFPSASSALQFIRTGEVRAIGVGTQQPIPVLPDVPPISTVLPGFGVGIWHGLLGPAGMDPRLVDRINALGNAVITGEEFRDALARNQAGQVVGGTPATFTSFLQTEASRWVPLVRAAGITAN